jgi:PAS domain S-box-containing protein
MFSAFIGYAIWRYELFNVNPTVAAENIVAAMPDSLILANSDGKISRVNDHAVELTGYNPNELEGKRLTELFLNKKQGEAVLLELAEKQEIRGFEAEIKTKTGNIRRSLLSGSVVKNKNGRSIGLTFIVHDITRFKQIEKTLMDAERFASIGKLAGMVGHDLRNPLAAMSGATFYLKTRYTTKLDKNGLEMLIAIEKSIDYSNKIVNDLVDYSKEIRLELENTSAKKVLEESFFMVTIPANIQVLQHIEDALQIRADVAKLTRVFVNLIKNAFEAMADGGTLTITANRKPERVEFNFSDTGEGIAPETLNKLWNPLFTTKTKGMGFGLVICKRIVEAHGGEIRVLTVLGKGSTLRFRCP